MSNEELSDTPGIAIVGMAARFPGARSVEEFWRNIRDGVESITFFSDEDLSNADPSVLTDPNFVRAGALLEDIDLFDASFFDLSAIEAEITDPQHRIFLEAAHEALESAGYDPEKYDGAIGVYAGAGMNTYLIFNLAPHQELVRSVGALPLAIGNDKDYLVTRVSYKLNLGGPSINVQTSCSTSLVAVSLACQSLLDYQCDMALAGGVSLRIPQKTGYQYQEGSITSPDGHCRAFDAKAQGTVFGDGLGIVVLKRLDEALADGDQIYAVIKGSAVNNDGALKIGYTAPSVDGQVRVIAEALSASGIAPETIGYVEAHGTGTPLGDPIEIAALKKAFGSAVKRKGFCAIGSVKTNVGHLDTAAGVAGLIKTALALKHKLLPPTLHFEQPNPQIDFDNSPFYVNTRLHQWTNGSTPRRAGVSSFGIGGTNAHVILEEAPAREPSGESRPYQLLLLSAKTPTALEAATDNLARFLREHPDANLADVAFTLQLGRKSLGQRRAVVCRDREEAIAALEARDPARVLTHGAGAGDKPVVFMFSGQGSQHAQMAAELYRTEHVFRQTVDDCSRLLKPLLGLDLREVIYPADERLADAAQQLQQTFITQPALFVVEYALAQLWMKWGVRPQAMIGHSIGEYTAACLSGVFTLEQALALVATRGRMMQSLPAGAMLAVNLPQHEVETLIGAQLSLAVVNSPSMCVVSGTLEAVDELTERLTRRGVNCRRLHTSHAFHSHMMEPIVGEFARHVSKLKLKPPTIPYISNLTGNWIRPEEATDPQYWARHLRETVRFGDGLARLTKDARSILLEIGPGQTLGALARAQASDHVILSTLRRPNDAESDAEYLLKRLGQIWLAGGKIDWQGFYADERRQRLPLPTYPFERRRYWIDAPRTTSNLSSAPSTQATDGESQVPTPDAASNAEATPATHDAASEAVAHRAAHERPLMGTPYVAPRNETEQKIAHIWESFLSVKEVGVEDNFFELGGHSLLATQLIALLRDAFRLPLPLGALFQSPTVSGLAQEIARLRQDSEASASSAAAVSTSFDSLPKIVADREQRYEPFPLTDIQQAYWVGRSSSLELGGVATHIYFEVEGTGIDLERLERAWRRVIARHDMLRAIVLADGRQQVLESVPPYEIEVSDFSELDAEDALPQLEAVRARMSHQVIPADRWPLFEIHASKLSGGRLRLHVSFDMLIGDAWSFQLLWRDLLTYYTDETAQLPELEVTFRDYVLTENNLRETPLYEQAREYWWNRIDEMPGAPELPLARSPATLTQPQFVRRTARLAAAQWEELKRRARQAGLTPSGVLLAAYAEVLSLWSKRQHFMINLTLFNRLPLHEQIEQVVGDFTSLTLLEADYRGGGSFRERGRKLQEQLWEDIDRRYVSGVAVMRELARRRGAAQAVMPVIFTSELNFGNANDEASQQDVSNEETAQAVQLEQVYSISQTPQVWIDHQASEVQGELVFNWDVVEELFPEGVLQQMFDTYCSLLERLAQDEASWDAPRLLPLPPAQAARRAAYNDTQAPLSDALLHQLFLQQVEQHPHRPALISTQRSFTYAELEHFTRRLARQLRHAGARPNQLIGVVMQKGWEQTAAVLSVLRAGAAYLPISADLPHERICYLLNHGQVDVVLTQTWIDERFEWPQGIQRIPVTQFDEAQDAVPEEVELDTLQSDEDLAYVIYTSGSTGTPKGVMIDHRGAVNTILDINERFHISPSDRVLALSSLSFDLSVYDIFGTLAAGATVVIPDATASPDPAHWAEMVESYQVSVWNTVPALMQMLVEYVGEERRGVLESLRLVMLSGDWIGLSLPDEIRKQSPRAHMVSLGGATEASIWSILYEIGEVRGEWKSIPYGHPMRNQQIYVLNERMEECPEWVTGQLYIGGVGLARGYWRDEERTARSFVEHERWGERLYRTGDVGRQVESGEVEFLGREDYQVKVQGHRIELGEVEAALSSYEKVKAAVVSAVGERQGSKSLVAYVVGEDSEAFEASELRGFLKEKLPEYMIPSAFVFLEALPLTSNGKVNRNALPAPEQFASQTTRDVLLPRTHVEEMLANVWAELLGIAQISLDDNFFELGGQSLMATQVLARVRNTFRVEMPLRVLFERPTLETFAAAVEESLRSAQRSNAPQISRVSRDEDLPLSFAQQRLWFLDRLEPESVAYNLPAAIRLTGRLDVLVLEQSLREIIRRHESLRTTFGEDKGRPLQVIAESQPFALEVVDLSGLAETERETRARQLASEEAQRPFNLTRGPLLRARLLKLREDEHVALFTMHHIVSDGWSIGVLMREVSALYTAFVVGQPSPLQELPIQYADFAAWQRGWLQGETLEEQLAYWRRQLSGEASMTALPTDRPRTATRTYRGGLQAFSLSKDASDKLKELSRREGATLYMTLLAGLKTLLSRYGAQEEITVGTPIANRNWKELESLIGFFVNTLVLRTDLSGNPTFKELLGRVREVTLGAYAHQDVPFEKLVEELQPERDLSGSPFFNVMFAFQNAPEAVLELPHLTLDSFGADTGTAMFDLNLLMQETPHGLSGVLTYQTDLFDSTTVERLLGHFVTLLESIAAAPDARLSELLMLTNAERRHLLIHLNNTAADYPRDVTLHELIAAQVERTPDALAVVFGDERLTYAELNERANRLAHYLQTHGVGAESFVAVIMQRSVEMVVSLLGILKAGAAYLPLDPSFPPERLALMLAESQTQVLLTQQHLAERLPATTADILSLDTQWHLIAGHRTENPSHLSTPENAAYLIYTSGSTGRPKGVINTHSAIVNRLLWMQDAYRLDSSDCVLQKTPFSFDVSVWEFFWPLLAGARLVLAAPEGHKDPAYLRRLINEQEVTTLHFVPSMLHAFIESRELEQCRTLRRVICSGEALSVELQTRFFAASSAQLHNLYGPTEAAVDVTFWECQRGTERGVVPIGRPIANTQIYILDSQMQVVPIGVRGEVYIGGAGLARGYVGRPELTAERFVPDAYGGREGGRLYRTGDVARYLSGGEIEYVGRADYQVKVRGYRIELGEIEAALVGHPSIREAVVVAVEGVGGDKQLVAYYVVAGEEGAGAAEREVTVEELRGRLQERLPEYMVPAFFVKLEALPLTPNGKLDRKALPEPERGRRQTQGEGERRTLTPVEEVLVGIWSEVLGVSEVGLADNFFEMGGHSLLATQVVSRVNRAFQVEMPVRRVFESPSVAALARSVESAVRENRQLMLPPILRVERERETLPLSFAQQRLWFLDQLEPESAAYNLPAAIRLTGQLDLPALEQTLNEIIRRHEILRTTFAQADGDVVQVIHPAQTLRMPLLDLCGLDESEREAELQGLVAEISRQPFDLSEWPLLRVRLIRLGTEEHVVLLVMHHIITDGWSLDVFVKETVVLYEAFRRELPSPLAELTVQYADYAHWQQQWLRGEILEAHLSYWQKALADAPPVLHLPTDRPRHGWRSTQGAATPFRLSASLSNRLRELSRQEDATLFMLLLAAFQVLLRSYTGQDNIVVGTSIANRQRRELEELIGFFVNTLALNTDLSGNPSFRELLARVREVTLGAYDHQDLPFEKIQEEFQTRGHAGRLNIQVFFALLNAPLSALELAGLAVTRLDIDTVNSKFELGLYVVESAEGIGGRLEYSTELYDAGTVARFLEDYRTLLEAVGENPEIDLASLSGLIEEDALLLDDFNADLEAM